MIGTPRMLGSDATMSIANNAVSTKQENCKMALEIGAKVSVLSTQHLTC